MTSKPARPPADSRTMSTHAGSRSCGFEQLESRQLLAADSGLVSTLAPTGEEPLASALSDTGGSIRGQVLARQDGATSPVGLPGVTIDLLNESGRAIQSTLTGSTGGFGFQLPGPGTFALQQVQPEGYESVMAQLGTGGGVIFEPNLMGEIVVASDAALNGYQFVENLAGTAPQEINPRAVQHGVDQAIAELASIENLFLQLSLVEPVVTPTTVAPERFIAARAGGFDISQDSLRQSVGTVDASFGGNSLKGRPTQDASKWDTSLGQWPLGHMSGILTLIPAVGEIWKVSGEFPLSGDNDDTNLMKGAKLLLNQTWSIEPDADALQDERDVDLAHEENSTPLPQQTKQERPALAPEPKVASK